MNKLFNDRRGEGYVDTGVKILIAVVIGALLLGGLYLLFNQVILPETTNRVEGLFSYGTSLSATNESPAQSSTPAQTESETSAPRQINFNIQGIGPKKVTEGTTFLMYIRSVNNINSTENSDLLYDEETGNVYAKLGNGRYKNQVIGVNVNDAIIADKYYPVTT